MSRFPKYCLKCQTSDHWGKDCDRLPANLGKSDYERDYELAMRYDACAILLAAGGFVLCLVIFAIVGG